jgi:putative phosphoesterase
MGTRIAVLADTHLRGGRGLPEPCAAAIRAADAVIHAGDFVTEEALAEIQSIGPPLSAVHGNVDEPALRQRLPGELEIEVEGVRIAVVHDAGRRSGRVERMRALFPQAGCVIFGHTHQPEHVRAGGFQLFNPGSPTQRRRASFRAMGFLDIGRRGARFSHLRL